MKDLKNIVEITANQLVLIMIAFFNTKEQIYIKKAKKILCAYKDYCEALILYASEKDFEKIKKFNKKSVDVAFIEKVTLFISKKDKVLKAIAEEFINTYINNKKIEKNENM